jgi:hypothetical protein
VVGHHKILSVPYKRLKISSHTIFLEISINTKVGTANSGKEFSEITENSKSRKIKEFKSKMKLIKKNYWKQTPSTNDYEQQSQLSEKNKVIIIIEY